MHSRPIKWALQNVCTSHKDTDCFVQPYASFALALYIIDALCQDWGKTDNPFSLEKTRYQGCTLSLVAYEETTLLCVTLHWSRGSIDER